MPGRAVREGSADVALSLAELGLPGGPWDHEMPLPGSEPERMCQMEFTILEPHTAGLLLRRHTLLNSIKATRLDVDIKGERAAQHRLLVLPGIRWLLHVCPLEQCWTGELLA